MQWFKRQWEWYVNYLWYYSQDSPVHHLLGPHCRHMQKMSKIAWNARTWASLCFLAGVQSFVIPCIYQSDKCGFTLATLNGKDPLTDVSTTHHPYIWWTLTGTGIDQVEKGIRMLSWSPLSIKPPQSLHSAHLNFSRSSITAKISTAILWVIVFATRGV